MILYCNKCDPVCQGHEIANKREEEMAALKERVALLEATLASHNIRPVNPNV